MRTRNFLTCLFVLSFFSNSIMSVPKVEYDYKAGGKRERSSWQQKTDRARRGNAQWRHKQRSAHAKQFQHPKPTSRGGRHNQQKFIDAILKNFGIFTQDDWIESGWSYEDLCWYKAYQIRLFDCLSESLGLGQKVSPKEVKKAIDKITKKMGKEDAKKLAQVIEAVYEGELKIAKNSVLESLNDVLQSQIEPCEAESISDVQNKPNFFEPSCLEPSYCDTISDMQSKSGSSGQSQIESLQGDGDQNESDEDSANIQSELHVKKLIERILEAAAAGGAIVSMGSSTVEATVVVAEVATGAETLFALTAGGATVSGETLATLLAGSKLTTEGVVLAEMAGVSALATEGAAGTAASSGFLSSLGSAFSTAFSSTGVWVAANPVLTAGGVIIITGTTYYVYYYKTPETLVDVLDEQKKGGGGENGGNKKPDKEKPKDIRDAARGGESIKNTESYKRAYEENIRQAQEFKKAGLKPISKGNLKHIVKNHMPGGPAGKSTFNEGTNWVELAIEAWKKGQLEEAGVKVFDLKKIIGINQQGVPTSKIRVVLNGTMDSVRSVYPV